MNNIIKCTVTKSRPSQDLGLGLEEHVNHRIYVTAIGGLIEKNFIPVAVDDQLLEVNGISVMNKERFPNGLKDVELLLRKEWNIWLKVKKGAAKKVKELCVDDDDDDGPIAPTVVYRTPVYAKPQNASSSALIDDTSYHFRKKLSSKWTEKSDGRWDSVDRHNKSPTTTFHSIQEPRIPSLDSSCKEPPIKEVSKNDSLGSDPKPSSIKVSDDERSQTRRPRSSKGDSGNNDRVSASHTEASAQEAEETDTTVSSTSFTEDVGFLPLEDPDEKPEKQSPKKPRSIRKPRSSSSKKPRSSSKKKTQIMISDSDFESDEESIKSYKSTKSTRSTRSTKSTKSRKKPKSKKKVKRITNSDCEGSSDEESLKSCRSTKSTKSTRSTKSRKKSKSKRLDKRTKPRSRRPKSTKSMRSERTMGESYRSETMDQIGSTHSCYTNLIDPGDLMKIHGFVSKPEMNGMTVEVVRKSKGMKGKRWDVSVITEKQIKMKSSFNVKRLISVSVDNLKHFM